MRLLVAVVLTAAGCIWIGCGDDPDYSVDPRGGLAPTQDCVERLAAKRRPGPSLKRQSLLRRMATIRELRTGTYTVFASGPGGPPVVFDQSVALPVSLRTGFVSWRHADSSINVVSHTATTRYTRDVLRCGGFTPRVRTPDGTVWRPGRELGRIIIERRGILVAGQNLPLLRRIAAATSAGEPNSTSRDWEALRGASGRAVALASQGSSCADFQVLRTLSKRGVGLTVSLAQGQRLRGVRAPRGVPAVRVPGSGRAALLRATVPDAERAVIVFAGVPPNPAQPWTVSCDRK